MNSHVTHPGVLRVVDWQHDYKNKPSYIKNTSPRKLKHSRSIVLVTTIVEDDFCARFACETFVWTKVPVKVVLLLFREQWVHFDGLWHRLLCLVQHVDQLPRQALVFVREEGVRNSSLASSACRGQVKQHAVTHTHSSQKFRQAAACERGIREDARGKEACVRVAQTVSCLHENRRFRNMGYSNVPIECLQRQQPHHN
jgi:hypothetical protein